MNKSILLTLLMFCLQIECKSLDETAEPYFKSSEYIRMLLNPEGRYIAAETYYNAQEHVEVIDTHAKKTYVVFNGTNGIKISISNIQWIDNNTLIIQLEKLNTSSSASIFKVIHLKFGNKITVDSTFQFNRSGKIIDNLASSMNSLYFADYPHSKKYTAGIYKANLTDEETLQMSLHYKHKIAANITHAFYWLADSENNIRFIMSKQKGQIFYWFKKNRNWKKILTIDENQEDISYPLAITSENQFVAIKRLEEKDKTGVYLIDSLNYNVIKQLYYSDKYDVSSIKINHDTSEITTIRYTQDGMLKDNFLDASLIDASKIIQRNYPQFYPIYLSRSFDKSKILFLLHSFQNEGIYVLVDLNKNSSKKIIEKSSWKNKLKKGVLKTINFQTSDGYKIESYLSMPEDNDIKALVVVPHGGPIGVRSYSFFDSYSHFLASYGIAVLKINYRGSTGFGKKFQNAGKKQWGGKIESDINDVVTKVIKDFQIDNQKICSAGMSYGGYSAFMLHINFPNRYKCIISMAGPTDLPLMFTSSDWNMNSDSIKAMIDIVGDPQKDLEKLKSVSPLYNAKKINAPVLLVHGTQDPRINVEHSVRMSIVLNKLGKPVNLKLLKDVKHGFHLLKHEILYAVESLKHINKSLQLGVIQDEKEK